MWQVCQEPRALTGFNLVIPMDAEAQAVRASFRVLVFSTPKGSGRAHLRHTAGSRHIRSITTSESAYRMPRNDGSVETILATLTKPDGELMRFIRSKVDHRLDIEDIKQETCGRFVRLWNESPVPIEKPVAFIISIAEKVIFEHWRAVGYERTLFDRDATLEDVVRIQDRQDGPDDLENQRREALLLREGMKVALTPVQRAVLLLRLSGVSVAEAGLRFGLNEHKAERVLHDARESLREFIKSRERSIR
jgi:RNA polymerase sigma factor (sigma-70 family)